MKRVNIYKIKEEHVRKYKILSLVFLATTVFFFILYFIEMRAADNLAMSIRELNFNNYADELMVLNHLKDCGY